MDEFVCRLRFDYKSITFWFHLLSLFFNRVIACCCGPKLQNLIISHSVICYLTRFVLCNLLCVKSFVDLCTVDLSRSITWFGNWVSFSAWFCLVENFGFVPFTCLPLLCSVQWGVCSWHGYDQHNPLKTKKQNCCLAQFVTQKKTWDPFREGASNPISGVPDR